MSDPTKYRIGPNRTAPDRNGPTKLGEGSPEPGKTMGSPGTLLLWVGIRNSALTPIHSQGLKKHHLPCHTGPSNTRKLPHQTPKNLHRGRPSPVTLWTAQVPSPLWAGIRNSGIRNSALTPIYSQGWKRQISPYRTGPQNSRKLPHRTPRNLHRGLLSLVLWVAQVPSPYGWVSVIRH